MTTRFRTRAFLICFIPFAVLLACSFWMIQRSVESTVRDGLRASLGESQLSIARIHAKSDLQNSRFLKVAGENAALKAGVELLLSHPGNEGARRTVEDQLRELGEHMGFDFLLVSARNEVPLAGVARQSDANGRIQLVPVDTKFLARANSGLMPFAGRTLQIASVPIDQNEENIGVLSVGAYFDFSEFTTPVVLEHKGDVLESNIPGVSFSELTSALSACDDRSECSVRLNGANWLSLAMQSYGGGYVLRSLENVDRAAGPIQARLNRLFLSLTLLGMLVALLCSIVESQSIVRPLAAVVSHLRQTVRTGVLTEFKGRPSSILEIRELAEIFNRAAVSVQAAGEELQSANLEFVGSLANALDARDRYTSGHSHRVSELACATAAALQHGPEAIERIRIGAILHDMGKIGISDSVLQKPGRLTDEEFAHVKEHPVIGRRILEGVQGLAAFLPAVELHHENWDGSGYPRGQRGEETPIDARIIHVCDAYDAMTTDRSYRRGMTHERAISIIVENAAIQFDPRIVAVFLRLPREILTRHAALPDRGDNVDDPAMAVAG
ncbi:MAG TPA: HD-GYP domain-containing protein [Terracidiphilus sp.]|nr:HD-GYP domain-containing protein [Terracidiphilus sp.]